MLLHRRLRFLKMGRTNPRVSFTARQYHRIQGGSIIFSCGPTMCRFFTKTMPTQTDAWQSSNVVSKLIITICALDTQSAEVSSVCSHHEKLQGTVQFVLEPSLSHSIALALRDEEAELLCSWFDTERQRWSQDGSETIPITKDPPTSGVASSTILCECTHVTDFALVLKRPIEWESSSSSTPTAEMEVLSILLMGLFSFMASISTIIGCILSERWLNCNDKTLMHFRLISALLAQYSASRFLSLLNPATRFAVVTPVTEQLCCSYLLTILISIELSGRGVQYNTKKALLKERTSQCLISIMSIFFAFTACLTIILQSSTTALPGNIAFVMATDSFFQVYSAVMCVTFTAFCVQLSISLGRVRSVIGASRSYAQLSSIRTYLGIMFSTLITALLFQSMLWWISVLFPEAYINWFSIAYMLYLFCDLIIQLCAFSFLYRILTRRHRNYDTTADPNNWQHPHFHANDDGNFQIQVIPPALIRR